MVASTTSLHYPGAMRRRHLLALVILALVVALCGANANWEDLVYESGFTLFHGDGSGGEWGRRKRWKRLPGEEAIDEAPGPALMT